MWSYCEKHIAAGRTWNGFYPLKLLELWDMLCTEMPRSIIELGSGCTTAVFAEYLSRNRPWRGQSTRTVVSVDESPDWQAAVKETIGQTDIEFVCSEVLWSERGVRYSDYECFGRDFIYVDGPSNRRESKGPPMPCLDAFRPMEAGGPSIVAFDIRRETVSYLMQHVNGYRWSLSAWQEADTPWYLSGIRHHTVARRMA